ncbi:MAG: ABC transporter ATP-binding protein [Anaerolineaceae bacterium]|nr:ABC transporter ATP-binding protein [Anaerolineaceae bacterium]
MTQNIILETKKIRKEFGALVAVHDIDIKVKANSIHSVIGPNGAGKTTLFNLVSGTMPPTSGKVFFKGQDITNLPIHQTAHLGMGRSFQITNLFPNLTVLENVRLACQSLGKDNFRFYQHFKKFKQYEERAYDVLAQVGLKKSALLHARSLPHGDQRKLELAMILAPDPEVLLLDEPTAGLAAEQVPELMALIQKFQQSRNKTIVLVEHNMSVIMSVSDFITVMHHGEAIAEGTPTEIANNQTVQTAYLGGLYGDLNKIVTQVEE